VRLEGELEHLLKRNGIDPESTASIQMKQYLWLLEKWNRRVNLTASTDWLTLGPLCQEAIWACQFYPSAARSLLDIGSGAGFPAIPMKIIIPEIHLEMVESNGKKAAFLETVISQIGLSNTEVHHRRLQEHLKSTDRRWGCVSWKGLKLGSKEISQLCEHAHAGTQFWMFHGREAAVEDPEILERHFRLLRREKCVGRENWWLSIYGLR